MVNKIYMKIKHIICISFITFFSGHLLAQAKRTDMLDKFDRSVEKAITYPGELITQCKPTYALMKIVVDAKSKVDRMEVSDNADKLFVLEFLSAQKDLNRAALEVYLKENGLKDVVLLIPLIYQFAPKSCPANSIDIQALTDLTDFYSDSINGKPVMFLKPVGMIMDSVK